MSGCKLMTLLVMGVTGCGTLESQSHARLHVEMLDSSVDSDPVISKTHHEISDSLPCPDQIIYGGAVNRCALGIRVLTSRDGQAGAALIFGGPFLLLDLCSSTVLDTLILPMTISQQLAMDASTATPEAIESAPPTRPGAASASP